ncbi:MAG TPA: hypothetical protein VK633_01905, partial [Verrucomicrobiae bacterium]|nr:hypothetical protein [Verrucomicrobiae bacterium]
NGVDTFTLNGTDAGTVAVRNAAQSLLSHKNDTTVASARLFALSGGVDAQDYVVSAPETGATIFLFGIGVLALFRFRKLVNTSAPGA